MGCSEMKSKKQKIVPWGIILILGLLLILAGEILFLLYLDQKEEADKMKGWTCNQDNICVPTDQIAHEVSYEDMQKYLNDQRKK